MQTTLYRVCIAVDEKNAERRGFALCALRSETSLIRLDIVLSQAGHRNTPPGTTEAVHKDDMHEPLGAARRWTPSCPSYVVKKGASVTFETVALLANSQETRGN